jgi:chemotaxis response regulator CheB
VDTELLPQPAVAPLRVIVADDDALVRQVLRDVLQRAGIVVIAEADGGREAVELAVYYKPDLVSWTSSCPAPTAWRRCARSCRRCPRRRC